MINVNLLIKYLGYPFNDSTTTYFNSRLTLLTLDQVNIVEDLQNKITELIEHKHEFLLTKSHVTSDPDFTYYYSTQTIARYDHSILDFTKQISTLLNIPVLFTTNTYLNS